MKQVIRMLCGTVAFAVVPALISAQVKPDPKTMQGAKKPDSAAMKHDMKGMEHDKAGMKHDAKGMEHEGEHGEKSGWTELDAFHKLLQDTWHPAQKGDLRPARDKAAAFVAGAEAWARSKGPATCDNEAARKAIPGVVADANAYADAAKAGASDDAVKASLKKAHDGFEKVAMPCMMSAMKGMDHKKP